MCIRDRVTEILGVKIWVPALLWPMAYTALYYHTGVMHSWYSISASFIQIPPYVILVKVALPQAALANDKQQPE